MSSSKIALVILILIALVFAVSIGATVSHHGQSAKLEDISLPASLGSWLVPKQPLGPGEIKSDCLKERTFAFPASGRCEAKVAVGDVRLRTFHLRLKPGSNSVVKVHWLPNDDKDRPAWKPKDGIEIKQSLKADSKPLELQAPAAGGVLTLDLIPPGATSTTWVMLDD